MVMHLPHVMAVAKSRLGADWLVMLPPQFPSTLPRSSFSLKKIFFFFLAKYVLFYRQIFEEATEKKKKSEER